MAFWFVQNIGRVEEDRCQHGSNNTMFGIFASTSSELFVEKTVAVRDVHLKGDAFVGSKDTQCE